MGGRKDCRLCFSSRLLGTSFEATHWRSLDVCGSLGISCSLGVHLFAFGTIALHLIGGSFFSTALFLLLYTPVAGLALTSLYMAWATDPGAVPMGARPLVTVKRAPSGEVRQSNSSRQRALRRCHKCNDNYKPNRAHHDSVTGRCIVKFDHFCPWVGNAVGAMNHKFFVLFVGYTMLSCILSLVLIMIRAFHCGWMPSDGDDSASSGNNGMSDLSTGGANNSTLSDSLEDENRRFLEGTHLEECQGFFNSYATLTLLIVSVVFMIFTCCMLFEQIEAIETNASKIARMKMRVGQAGTELARVTEEFNEMFGGTSNKVSWHWFLPIEVEFPRGMKKVVLGYEWDETFDPVPYEEPSGIHGASSALSAGGAEAGRDEELGTVELTSTSMSLSNSTLKPAPLNPTSSAVLDGGEEASFSGTPVSETRPQLVKRSNSRGPDSRLKPAPGTLT